MKDSPMFEHKSSLRRKFEEFDRRLTEQECKYASQDVLSGNEQMKANALQIKRAYAAKLADELANGSKHPERRAMIAAEVEALKLCFSTWFALLDRSFNASQ